MQAFLKLQIKTHRKRYNAAGLLRIKIQISEQ
jgi:hypothetical protein